MILIYRIFYFILKHIVLLLQRSLGSDLQNWIALRQKSITPQIDLNNTYLNNTYWFHAASGEIEYCKSVIRLLKEQQPAAQIIVTYSSPSAEKLFHNITDCVTQFLPLPWDEPAAVRQLIDSIRPKILVFSRTDLWPVLINEVKKRNVRLGLISYNPRFTTLSRLIQKSLLPQFNFISCIDESVKSKLQEFLPNTSLSADGDTRYDQVFHRLAQPARLQMTSDRPLFVCGSTWVEDESILFKIFPQLLQKSYRIILSPHDVAPANIQRIKNSLNCSYQVLSEEKNLLEINLNSDVLIIDKIGYLADVYRYGRIAFVGGSFKEKIHSVMEPLCCGLPVITGPYYYNNPEAVRYLGQFVFATAQADELLRKFEDLDSQRPHNILPEMQKNRNASARVLQRLQF